MSPLAPSRAASAATQQRRQEPHDTSLTCSSLARSRCDLAAFQGKPLGAYRDSDGRRRELVAIRAAGGSTIVLDRDAATLADRRLVAHLGADEPVENAALVCRHYLDEPDGRWCRPLSSEDLLAAGPGDDPLVAGPGGDFEAHADFEAAANPVCAIEADGWRYRMLAVPGEHSSRQLRWCRRALDPAVWPVEDWQQVRLRDVVGALESYEPMRTLTARALVDRRDEPRLLLRRLCSEYERLCTSPIVLNRRLRESVLRSVERDGTSLSELALRCGIVKRDSRGRVSGETSWLARRIGLMAEGGRSGITPWIHSDVLALIARQALRVSPREVEVP